MDWSLLDPFASKKFLRDHLALKPVWTYYAAMVIDPILRFNWIFYAIYTNDTEHSARLSFLIALSEILRRGVWVIFRVENEHCTNVGRGRASRDFPLPYHTEHHTHVATDEDATQREEHWRQGVRPPLLTRMTSYTSGWSILGTHTDHIEPSSGAIRRKQRLEASPLLRRVGSILHTAHAQDFERKKRSDGHEVKHSKDEEEEEVLDVEGRKVDAEEEIARRVAEAVAEQAAKDAEAAEEQEQALSDIAWEGGGLLGESSGKLEGRVEWRPRGLDEGEADVHGWDSGAESPGSHDGEGGTQNREVEGI
jgi:phage gpG-like protein